MALMLRGISISQLWKGLLLLQYISNTSTFACNWVIF